MALIRLCKRIQPWFIYDYDKYSYGSMAMPIRHVFSFKKNGRSKGIRNNTRLNDEGEGSQRKR